MIKNYISENIRYLYKKTTLSQDDFGGMFEIGKGLISNYINDRALPKIETIQRICLHYEISIDDFVNRDLSSGQPYATKGGKLLYSNENSPEPYIISPKYVEVLEKALEDKEKIIKALESKLQGETKSKTA